jgi:hypothetical protein
MKRRSIHRGMLVALVLALAAGVLGPQATRVQAGTINITNVCKDSVTQDAIQLDVSHGQPASVKSLRTFNSRPWPDAIPAREVFCARLQRRVAPNRSQHGARQSSVDYRGDQHREFRLGNPFHARDRCID